MRLLGTLHGYPVYFLSEEERMKIYKKSGKACVFACCSHSANKIYVFDEMSVFTEKEVLFILLHEVGHLSLHTSDEDACDNFAMGFFSDGEKILATCNTKTAQKKPLVLQDLISKGVLPGNYDVRSRRH